ncbi:MAG: KEOPS complex subunit Cgi121 [Candidatus Bathyarchaeota archaeon]|nr:KEOPS complex subunit Cgi121 [Candidatus Bathyarchaeota archaeon]
MSYSYPITDSDLYVTITAAANTKITDINKTLSELDKQVAGTVFQLFDADKITDQHQLYYAAANAYYAMENKGNISNKLEVETLLYASTQNQISKAIKLIGVSEKTQRIAIVVISEQQNDSAASKIAEYLGDVDLKALEMNQTKFEALKNLYEITDTAIETVGCDKYKALTSLITEKSTLISLRR